jgi:carbonic anhydrase/acetyltransferase-like protein (isoleucine patch superfamily)
MAPTGHGPSRQGSSERGINTAQGPQYWSNRRWPCIIAETELGMPIFSLDDASPHMPADRQIWIAPNAMVIGKVSFAADCSVWFGATVRGDNEWITVGAGTNIQEGCVLHTDMGFPLIIGEQCTIGHRAILHGCQIGAGSLIGMGATILNGACIGAHCLIGANALVTEGKEFADHSLVVGAPAKMVRRLTLQESDRLIESASHYVANWKRFRAGLQEIGTEKS